VSFILLCCNFHLSFNHCIFTLLCVLYVLFYCTNPAFGCYISINSFFFFFNKQRQSTERNSDRRAHPAAWPHPFFIHHRTLDRRGAGPHPAPSASTDSLMSAHSRSKAATKSKYRYNNNNDRFTALCPGLPRWAGARRNTHPPTTLIIIQSLSASSTYHDP